MKGEEIDRKLEEIQEQQRRTSGWVQYEGEDEVVLAKDYALEVDTNEVEQYSTGIDKLDLLLGKITMGNLYAVSGPEGEGKTTLLQTLTANLADQGVKSLWLSYEVLPQHFINKFPDFEKSSAMFTIPKKNVSGELEWIRDKIEESRAKFSTKVVFIDTLEYLLGFQPSMKDYKSDTKANFIGAICTQLTNIAKELNCAIFLTTDMRKTKEVPTKDDLRDSRLIGHRAAGVLLTWRNPKDTSLNYLRIAKSREVGTLNADMQLVYVNKRYYQYDG